MWKIVTDESFLGAFLLMLGMMAAGYFLRRRVIPGEGKATVSTILWKLALPAMAFSAFMQDFSVEALTSGGIVFLAATVFYLVWAALGTFLFRRCGREKARVAGMMIALGQLTLFSLPLLRSLGNEGAVLFSGVMTLPFRFVLYLVAFPILTGKKTGKSSWSHVLLNPVMLAMLLGMVVWATQGILPTVNGVPLLRLDLTLPALWRVVKAASDLVNPLAMLLIGMNTGECNIVVTLRDKAAWWGAAVRMLVCPLSVLLVTRALPDIFSPDAVLALTLGFAAPASVTVVVFCSAAHREERFASHIAALSALLSIVTVPLFYVLAST